MQRTEAEWAAEFAAFSLQSSDYVELAEVAPELREWRDDMHNAFLHGEDDQLATWDAYLHFQDLAIPLEQCCLRGVLLSPEERDACLQGCPLGLRKALGKLYSEAPLAVQEYLGLYFSHLVQIERTRRTGRPEWRAEPPSGSSEVLQELMFKWGPRFTRFRSHW